MQDDPGDDVRHGCTPSFRGEVRRRMSAATLAITASPWPARLAACARGLCLALLALGVLNGCQGLPLWQGAEREAAAQPPETNDLDSVVHYAARIQNLSPRALEREYERLADEEGATHAIRMALLLSHPEAPFQDAERARRLLAEYLQRPRSQTSCCREFAAFLGDSLVEQRHSQARVSDTLVALRRERKALQQEVQQLRSAVAEERAKRTKLESQIEALKAIEKSLDKVDRVEQRLQD